MRLQRIQIKNLFQLYNHTIELKPDRVTVLHGPNGVGKTAILRLLHGFFQNQPALLLSYPFECATLTFDDASVLRFQSSSASAAHTGTLSIDYHGSENISPPIHVTLNDEEAWKRAQRTRLLEPGLSSLLEPGRHLLSSLFASNDELLGKFAALQQAIPTLLIETQRLLTIHRERFGAGRRSSATETTLLDEPIYPSILKKPFDLQDRVQATLAKYSQTSNRLDQSFPERLLREETALLPKESLKDRLQKIEERRTQLQTLGILERNPKLPFDLSSLDHMGDSEQKVLTMYVQDNEAKLALFEPLLQKLKIFLEKINQHFRKKRLAFDLKSGFLLQDIHGRALQLDALSSGEQHTFVVFYELLFETAPGTLVLFDEPEISLHLAWQKDLMPLLLEIADLAKIDILLATHSPYVVGNRFDLMVELDAESSESLPS